MLRVYRGPFRQWIESLRHTNLEQANGTLLRATRYHIEAACCLGVGCLLVPHVNPFNLVGDALPPHSFIEWLGLNLDVEGVVQSDGEQADLIPDWPAEGLTLRDLKNPTIEHPDGQFDPGVERTTAASLNDSWKLTFPQIADVFDYFGIAGVQFVDSIAEVNSNG